MKLPLASNKTAFYTGVWAGAVSWIYLYSQTLSLSVQNSNYTFLVVAALSIVPTYPFVFGNRKFYTGLIRSQVRARVADFVNLAKRIIAWAFGAAIVLLPYAYQKIGAAVAS